MSKSEHKNSPEPSGSKSRFSIVYKLNSKLILRLLGIFLALDIIICIFASMSMIVYCEQKAASAAEIILISGMPDDISSDWLQISGLSVKVLEGEPAGFTVPDILSKLFPESTATGTRSFEQTSAVDAPIFKQLEGLVYTVAFDQSGKTYEISVELEAFIHLFRFAFLTLLVIEILILLSRAIKDAHLIRSTLDPISELTKAAQSLNSVGSQFNPEKMEALAGKLEGINASRLDTRIQINETQDELKNLARAINGMLDRINESYRAQVRFVSDASHELRTPISVIQGYANLLDRWGKNDEKTLLESIGAIKDEAANMKDLVEQLLFLARGDNDTITLQFDQFKLSELATEVIHETKMIDSAHNYQVRLSDISVSADKALIKQALRILVDNAIKYTPSGGNIMLVVDREGEFSKLSVQDDGIGISPEAIPLIFDRFYRADESRTRATGGSGLGLSIAKWISLRHGGHMEVLSREGIGTKITIVLPAINNDSILPIEA